MTRTHYERAAVILLAVALFSYIGAAAMNHINANLDAQFTEVTQ